MATEILAPGDRVCRKDSRHIKGTLIGFGIANAALAAVEWDGLGITVSFTENLSPIEDNRKRKVLKITPRLELRYYPNLKGGCTLYRLIDDEDEAVNPFIVSEKDIRSLGQALIKLVDGF